MVKIITEITACLPSEIQLQNKIPVIPQSINFRNQNYIEGENITNQSFINLLKETESLPKPLLHHLKISAK